MFPIPKQGLTQFYDASLALTRIDDLTQGLLHLLVGPVVKIEVYPELAIRSPVGQVFCAEHDVHVVFSQATDHPADSARLSISVFTKHRHHRTDLEGSSFLFAPLWPIQVKHDPRA